MVFFTPENKIIEARERMRKYQLREEAAKAIGGKIYFSEEEIEEVKAASRITGGSVHPETN